MPLWNVKDFGATGRFNPSSPQTSTDDTLAILTALAFASTNQQWGTVYFPAGIYQITDNGWGSPASQSVQALTIAGGATNYFSLTIVAGTAPSLPTLTAYSTGGIYYDPTPSNTASNIQNAIRGLHTSLPAFNSVTVSYVGSPSNWYLVTFPSSLGSPVISGGGPSLIVTVNVIQSGAALVASNFSALRLLGDGAGYADYDQGGTIMSRSALVWNGTANGVLLHLLGCQDITIENLAIWGAPTKTAGNPARTGLLFSSAQGSSASPTGTRLTCRGATFTRCSSILTPAAGGCVQLGMNPGDVGADTTVYEACNFSYGTNGLLVASQGAVNHHLHGCSLDTVTNGAWFQQGGNLQWDGCRARAVGTVLKIGTGKTGYLPSAGGGGSGSSSFLLRNVRTDPAAGPNVTVVDSTYAAPGTSVTVEGWDDTNSTSTSISFVQSISQPTTSSPATNPSVTLTVTVGNTLIAFGSIKGTTPPSQTAISDNQGNVWMYVPHSGIVATSNAAAAAWYCASAAGGSTTITFNSGSVSAALVVHEYSGVDIASPVDGLAVASGTNATPNSGTLNTNYTGEMLVGFTAQGTTNVTYSATGGFFLRASNASGTAVEAYASEDLASGAPGPYAAMFSQGTGNNANWVCIGLSLKPTGSALVVGAGSSVQVRDSLASRSNLAEEGAGNAPTPTLTAALRLENLIVPEGKVGAGLCPNLSANTKVEHVAERTGTYNIVRPDVATIMGRPRFSYVNWLILQQNPKFFYDLGDVGTVAPNQGWNLFLSSTTPRLDGQYSGSVVQNVQGIVLNDAVGGFNTRASGTAGTGYVTLRSGSVGLGPVSGKGWTVIVAVKRNASTSSTFHPILWNLGALPAAGGLQLAIDDTHSSKISFTLYNGSVSTVVYSNTTWGPSTVGPIYIMVQVVPSGTINIYTQGYQVVDNTGTFTPPAYSDSTVVPLIGASAGGSTVADLQIARLATFDVLVPLPAWANIMNYGNFFQGR